MKEIKYRYLKTYNSQATLDLMFDKLSDKEKVRLTKMAEKIIDQIDKFKDVDSAYSILMHLLNNKISIVEKETTVKKVVAVQKEPFERMETVDLTVSGEIKW